jgi:CheY-like chemotaxis protein
MARVLIVDDNQNILTVAHDALEDAGHEVTAIVDSLEIENILKTSEFDILITDIFMPGKEGLEVIAQAREMLPQLKVIAMSGTLAFGDMLSLAVDLGADAKIEKPFRVNDLLAKVNMVLEEDK